MKRRAQNTPYFFLLISFLAIASITLTVFSQGQNKASSIVIHDNTSAANGGENATDGLRSRFNSALQREKPCVETMNDQDIRDAIQDERERELLEGGDPDAALRAIGERMGASLVMSVQAMPGPGGTTVYSAFVMDSRTGRTVARATRSENDVAESLVRQLGPYLTDTCKPHWTGTIRYNNDFNETKQETDGGPAHSTWRNVTREKTLTSKAFTMIKATFLPPAAGDSTGSQKARVVHRVQYNAEQKETTSGETRCREPGKNPYFTNFSQDYSEIMTQLGQGVETTPVFITIDDDGTYTIKVNAPAGTMLGKIETSRSYTGCPSEKKDPTNETIPMPEGRFTGTSFEAEGKVDPKNRSVLAGTQTSPDGKTKITWNLRLVRPKGK
ncbi:MAG: hypothetical protein QUS14_04465 [Pyrinomonadaceae bacterium]|nr:hypothetical protein [Pyrinomonadaceae bacterium]